MFRCRAPLYAAYTAEQISMRLNGPSLQGWALKVEPKRNCIQKTFVFKDFDHAWDWMGRVVPAVQKADHHPEWFNVYNKVDVILSTHDEGGVTMKDFSLAALMNTEVRKQPTETLSITDACSLIDELVAGFNTDDVARLSAWYAHDCKMIVDGVEKKLCGKECAELLLQFRSEQRAAELKLSVWKVFNSTYWADFVCGSRRGRFHAVWEKQAKGGWKVVRNELKFD